jgi:hypothetical protein
MKVSMRDLTVWSFLMPSAHGAGLMVLPLVLRAAAAPHCATHAAESGTSSAVWATIVHSGGYLGVSAAVALVVFERLGAGLLRKAWFNLDLVWAVALVSFTLGQRLKVKGQRSPSKPPLTFDL